MGRPFVAGIVGGVGAGKSAVAGLFRDRGATVLDADAMAGEVLREGTVKAALEEAYGEGILGADGEVDRKRLADAAFGPPSRTGPLNRVVHPRVARRLEAEASSSRAPLVVVDAALLIEGGLSGMCDAVIFVDAPEAVRKARARSRGWPEGEWERREASQAPVDGKRARSDVIVDNGGPLKETRRRVKALYERWTGAVVRGANGDRDRSIRGPSNQKES